MRVTHLRSEQIKEAEALIDGYPEIFSKTDTLNYRKDLKAQQNDPTSHFLVLNSDKELVGIIGYKKDENSHNSYNVDWLIIKKGHEHQGLGSQLMTEVENHVRKEGGRHIYLETSAVRHNQQAKDFYKHLGFIQVGLLPDYFDHPKKKYQKLEDAALYHKSI